MASSSSAPDASHSTPGTFSPLQDATTAPDAAASSPPDAASSTPVASSSLPVACIVIGMAGSGKTTLVQRMASNLASKASPTYILNLDPAVVTLPYAPNIDIRDSLPYKNVMATYNLGPNGAILTALNLFATRFDQVLDIVEKRESEINHLVIDTPGQIEAFTWSASGEIICDAVASKYPAVVLYVIDTPMCMKPMTFVSNMLYACSVLYKTRLPMVVVFNKSDVVSDEEPRKWMTGDCKELDRLLKEQTTFAGTLAQSMVTALEEFYKELDVVGMSAATGEGTDGLFDAIASAAKKYETEYKVEKDRIRQEVEAAEKERVEVDLSKLKLDASDEPGGPSRAKETRSSASAGSSSGARKPKERRQVVLDDSLVDPGE